MTEKTVEPPPAGRRVEPLVGRMRELLLRLRSWDMMDVTADGPYWKTEIDTVLGHEDDAYLVTDKCGCRLFVGTWVRWHPQTMPERITKIHAGGKITTWLDEGPASECLFAYPKYWKPTTAECSRCFATGWVMARTCSDNAAIGRYRCPECCSEE